MPLEATTRPGPWTPGLVETSFQSKGPNIDLHDFQIDMGRSMMAASGNSWPGHPGRVTSTTSTSVTCHRRRSEAVSGPRHPAATRAPVVMVLAWQRPDLRCCTDSALLGHIGGTVAGASRLDRSEPAQVSAVSGRDISASRHLTALHADPHRSSGKG